MLLFRSEEHIEAWYQPRGIPKGANLTLEQQWELARIWYAGRMSPDWRRRSPEESQAVLESLELTGKFWHVIAPTD